MVKPATVQWLIVSIIFGLQVSSVQATGKLTSEDVKPTICRVQGLSMTPPADWEAATAESPLTGIHSCHTVRLLAGRLHGVLRVVSVDLAGAPDHRPWYVSTVSVEANLLQAFGVSLSEQPLWVKESMPVRGDGFSDGRAMGIPAQLGTDPYELHLLLFRSDQRGYVISLLTPPESSQSEDYALNQEALMGIMRTLERSSKSAGVSGSLIKHLR